MILRPLARLDISAASGLLVHDGQLVAIADDELMLSRYDFDGTRLSSVRLFTGTLPDDPIERKHAKPDLEALVALPDHSLLALGSGSKKNRCRGALVRGDEVQEIDLEPLYDDLRASTDRLNVEGAVVFGPELVLLTRRTGTRGRNTLVRLDLRGAMAELARGRLRSNALIDIVDVELGASDGVAFGFGDATPWKTGLLFTAAAEDTDDPVEDGACVGAEIGWLDARGVVGWAHAVDPPRKLEGITSGPDGRVYAVADADDRGIRAPLFEVELPP